MPDQIRELIFVLTNTNVYIHTWSQCGAVIGVESIAFHAAGITLIATVAVASRHSSVVALIRRRTAAFISRVHPRHRMSDPPTVYDNNYTCTLYLYDLSREAVVIRNNKRSRIKPVR